MNPDERDPVATQFGVAAEQVERDHLSSHLRAFLDATSVTESTSSAAPSEAERQAQLAGQTRLSISAAKALKAIRKAWR